MSQVRSPRRIGVALLTAVVVALVLGSSTGYLALDGAPIGNAQWWGYLGIIAGAPLIDGWSRPLLTLAAIVLLVWALRERVSLERRVLAAVAAGQDGDAEACTTCRPLFAVR